MQEFGLVVTAANGTAEELFANWQELLILRVRADAHISEVRARFEKATTDAERDRLWNRLEQLWPSYMVLSAWADVMHAAWVFTTEGHDSVFMTRDESIFRI